jgi:hypothetical protein
MLIRETHAALTRHALCETSGHVNSGCDVTRIRPYFTRGSVGDVHPRRNAFNRINISRDENLGPVVRDHTRTTHADTAERGDYLTSSWRIQDSLVGIVTVCRLHYRGSIPGKGKWFFSSPYRPDWLGGSSKLFRNRYRTLFSGLMWLWREANLSRPA